MGPSDLAGAVPVRLCLLAEVEPLGRSPCSLCPVLPSVTWE